MKKVVVLIFLMVAMFTFVNFSRADTNNVSSEVVPGIPVKDIVTLVDLGAKTCIPCKMMAPILEELKVEYKGRAEVIFIDVWDAANKEKAKAFKIATIPTQVFYNKQGHEVYRHIGFLDKDSIVDKLEALLAE